MFRSLVIIALLSPCALRAQEPAPALSLRDTQSNPTSLEQHKGKVVVLNYWATWCGPCADEMPWLVKIQETYGDRGLVVIGVSLDDETTRGKVPKFMRKKKINFPIWLGGTTDDLKRFGLGEALPSTAFINREGQIEGRVLGMLRKKDLIHQVEWLLGNHEGEPPKPLVNNLGN